MTLTEVVYKIKSNDNLLCQATEKSDDLKIVTNQISYERETRNAKFLVTIVGDDARTGEVLQVLPKLYDTADVVARTKNAVAVRATASLQKLIDTKNPSAFSLQYFSDLAIVHPSVVKGGYYNTRVIVVGKVDLAELLADYEKGAANGLWDDFKLIRIDDFDPEQQVTGAFIENLTAKQLEVIKTALALGYYNTPRNITLDNLSTIFGISKAAVHNRLQAAERKVIGKFFS
jgi:predicted DNA binding protein